MADMRRRGMQTWFGLVLAAVLCVWGCEARPSKEFYGYLFFGAGNYLARLSLSTGDATPMANLGDVHIDHVSPLDNEELLLSVSNTEPGRDRFHVLRTHPVRLYSRVLLIGRQARYLGASGTIVYDDGAALVAVPRRNVKSESSVLQSRDGREPARLVALDGRGILFRTSGEVIRHFDPETGRSRPLAGLSAACRLEDAVWLADLARLLCRAAGQGEEPGRYRLVALDGRVDGPLPLPEGRRFRAVTYVAEQRVLILNETRTARFSRRERYPVWAYDFGTGELYAIAENQYLGTSAVYRRALH